MLTRTDENVPKWYVLDAKYRTKRRNVLEAMTSAHVYRDALRWHERRPECAVLLVPRGGGAPWLEQPDFISRQHVGVCAFGPGNQSSKRPSIVDRGKTLQGNFGSPTNGDDDLVAVPVGRVAGRVIHRGTSALVQYRKRSPRQESPWRGGTKRGEKGTIIFSPLTVCAGKWLSFRRARIAGR